MSSSSIVLNKDLSLSLVLGNQIELTKEEELELKWLERQFSMLNNAESVLKKEVQMLELELMSNPVYQKFSKLRSKISAARELKRKAQAVLDHEYEKLFKRRGIESAVGIYTDALPEAKPKTGRRGRPPKSFVSPSIKRGSGGV